MKMYRISKHASEDRFERMCFLMEQLGIGEEVCVLNARYPSRQLALTSTGVILVLGDDRCVITAYVATIKEAMAIWRGASPAHKNARMPNWLYDKIIANRCYYEDCRKLNQMLYGKSKTVYSFY